MPLDPQALGKALNEDLKLHSTLCRREAAAFQKAVQGGAEVVVACTQEARLFTELHSQTEGAGPGAEPPQARPGPLGGQRSAAERGGAYSPIRFVNIRETGGWSRDARNATPKLAALLAAAKLPQPEPVGTVSYQSAGRVLVIGPLEAAERMAALIGDTLDVTIFARGGAGAQERRWPVVSGRIVRLSGWLGAFQLAWLADNPIDLDLCTRCNACVAACPENAIGFDYQIDLAACRSHRECVKACDVAGAIDFTRQPAEHSAAFDIVLDLSVQPAFLQHARPQGYFHAPGGADAQVLLQLRDLVGEFEKPKFFAYAQKLCAHGRNEKTGCSACIDICSAEAIASDLQRQQVKVNPHLCVGCGACTTVCPTGAISYTYPRAADQGRKIRTLLATYLQAGGKAPVLLLHGQERGRALVEELGRAARLGAAQGVPADVIPVALWHSASTGIDLWLAAVAAGAAHIAVVVTSDDAPQYVDALRQQMEIAQALLSGLGYGGHHFSLLSCMHPNDLDQELQLLAGRRGEVPAQAARFAVAPEKRATLELALDHLVQHGRTATEPIALPAGAPFGAVAVDRDKCTLCMSCVSACPASALQDNPQLPQLRFVESNCVQCGLCAGTCPERAIALQPRFAPGAQRKQARVLSETQPYACVRCGKPFGTLKGVEAMLSRLSGHAMFQGAAAERLKMCADCRVIDIYSAQDEARITDP